MTGKLALRSSDAETINVRLSPSDSDIGWAQEFVEQFNSAAESRRMATYLGESGQRPFWKGAPTRADNELTTAARRADTADSSRLTRIVFHDRRRTWSSVGARTEPARCHRSILRALASCRPSLLGRADFSGCSSASLPSWDRGGRSSCGVRRRFLSRACACPGCVSGQAGRGILGRAPGSPARNGATGFDLSGARGGAVSARIWRCSSNHWWRRATGSLRSTCPATTDRIRRSRARTHHRHRMRERHRGHDRCARARSRGGRPLTRIELDHAGGGSGHAGRALGLLGAHGRISPLSRLVRDAATSAASSCGTAASPRSGSRCSCTRRT